MSTPTTNTTSNSNSNSNSHNNISAPPNYVHRTEQQDGKQHFTSHAQPTTGAVSVHSVTQGSIPRLHDAPSVHSLAAPLSPGSGSAGSSGGGNPIFLTSPHNASSFQFSEASSPQNAISLASIAPERIAAKLNMGTLTRQIQHDECREQKRALRKRWMVYGAVGLFLALGIGIIVGYFVFLRTSNGGSKSGNGSNVPNVGATDAPSVPRRLRDKPVPMIVPSSATDAMQQRTLGSAPASALTSDWAIVLPSADLSISQSTQDPLVRSRLTALSGAYRPRLFPYSDCGRSPFPDANAPSVSSIVLSINSSLVSTLGPEAYQLVVTTRNVSLAAAAASGIARGLETLVASMVAGGAPCVYRLPVMDSGMQRPAAVTASGLRGVWADVRNMSSSFSGITGKSLSRVAEVAAAAKLNSLILRLPTDFAQDALPTSARRTPVLPATAQSSNDSTSNILAETIASSSSRLVSLLPEIDFSSASIYSPALSICPDFCPTGPTTCGGLNLHMQAARDAQYTWWTDVKSRLGGNVKAAMVGSLFSPAYLSCLRRAGGGDTVEVPPEIVQHWRRMFDDVTVYHPATHTPVQGLAGVKTVPVVAPTGSASPGLAVDVPAGMTGAVVYLRNLVPAGASVESVAPMSVTVRGGGGSGVASAVGGGLLVDLPSQYLTQQSGMSDWIYMVAAKAWANGWVGSGVDATRLKKEVDGFREWVVGPSQ
ncbi:hypothetical protein BCR44DRAFT_67808 [Catenaria anguillulae PL171]|uniref:Uncharacterized protein n=1 Tax=Catenaria anguillulae PL171 TaxID=765915 RepID=A0A1Y2HU69_9FUNG|nr:hypothetical protein BCR44DRAFT_67808 [Catenaria anguillulae PL171]